jgi:hypothetical protein
VIAVEEEEKEEFKTSQRCCSIVRLPTDWTLFSAFSWWTFFFESVFFLLLLSSLTKICTSSRKKKNKCNNNRFDDNNDYAVNDANSNSAPPPVAQQQQISNPEPPRRMPNPTRNTCRIVQNVHEIVHGGQLRGQWAFSWTFLTI